MSIKLSIWHGNVQNGKLHSSAILSPHIALQVSLHRFFQCLFRQSPPSHKMFAAALIIISFAFGAYCQEAQTTVGLFIGQNSNEEFVGSVVDVNNCETTYVSSLGLTRSIFTHSYRYAVACTSGKFQAIGASTSCDPSLTVSFRSWLQW